MRRHRKLISITALVLLLTTTAAYGPPACDSKQQPLTVADILTRAGNVKRELRERERQVPGTGISAQTDYDISEKLLAANRAYRRFIDDELARLAASGGTAPDPSARRAAINALVSALRSLENPGVLGIKSANAQKLWREAITTLNTIITGLEAIQGGE